jgi:hypothetical protein
VPPAGIRDLARRAPQRQLYRDICQFNAELPSASHGRLLPLPRHALQRICPRSSPAAKRARALARSRNDLAAQPTIPCQACHQVHREGPIESRPPKRISVAGKPGARFARILRPSRADSLRRGVPHDSRIARWRAIGHSEPRSSCRHLLPVPCAAQARTRHGCRGEWLGTSIWLRRRSHSRWCA